MSLSPCPCGKAPTNLFVRHLHGGEVLLSPDCCMKWRVLTRIPVTYEADFAERFHTHFREAWNAAPRAKGEE